MPKYTPTQFKCSKCHKVQTHYTWDNDRRTNIHICECGNNLGIFEVYQAEKIKVPGIKTETKNRF